MQFIPGDNHCVEVLGEAWSTRHSERLARPAPLRTGRWGWEKGGPKGQERKGEKKRWPVEHRQIDWWLAESPADLAAF